MARRFGQSIRSLGKKCWSRWWSWTQVVVRSDQHTRCHQLFCTSTKPAVPVQQLLRQRNGIQEIATTMALWRTAAAECGKTWLNAAPATSYEKWMLRVGVREWVPIMILSCLIWFFSAAMTSTSLTASSSGGRQPRQAYLFCRCRKQLEREESVSD